MTWVITTDMSPRLLGGMGHTYFDILSAFTIARMYNLKYAHKPLQIAQSIVSWTHEVPPWDNFLGIGKNEESYNEKNYIGYKKVTLDPLKRFMSFTLEQLDGIFKGHSRANNILFTLSANNRFHLNELFALRKSLFSSIRQTLRERCQYQAQRKCGKINVHVRRGDVKMEPLLYYKRILDQVCEIFNAEEVTIVTFTSGPKQVEEIRNCFGPNVNYRINQDAIDDFRYLMDSDVLICPWSSYSKLAGFYSDARAVIFMPFYPVFFNPCKYKNGYLGHEPETYGKNWIPANATGKFDCEKFKSLMSSEA